MTYQNTHSSTDEFSIYVYRAGWWLCTSLGRFWLYGMIALTVAVGIEWLLITGQHAFGSGTWPRDGVIRAFIEGDWLTELRIPLLAAFAALGGLMLSLERQPVTLALWSMGCFASHVILIGALF